MTRQSRGNLDVNVAWLAGILDGEGHIGIRYEPRRERSASITLHIGSTSQELLAKCQGIIFDLTHRKPRIGLANGSRAGVGIRKKDYYQIQMYAQKDVRKVLEAALPHLTEKAERAQIVVDFCKIRMGKKRQGYGAQYGKEELALLQQMGKFQRKPLLDRLGPVETKSPALTAESGEMKR